MSLHARVSMVHGLGFLVLIGTLLGGYFYGYRPAALAAQQRPILQAQLTEYEQSLTELTQSHDPGTTSEPVKILTRSPGGAIEEMSPTVFLSTLESLAREIGLRVESSKELPYESESKDPAPKQGGAGALRVEVHGTGTFAGVMEFCSRVDQPLPGLEFRAIRIERGDGESVRWTMVCTSHNGLAG